MSLINKNSERVVDDEGELDANTLTGAVVTRNADGTVSAAGGADFGGSATILDAPINPAWDEDYEIPAGEQVDLARLTNGVEADARTGEAIAEDDYVTPNADGKLVTYDSADKDAGTVVGKALESAAGADELINVVFF